MDEAARRVRPMTAWLIMAMFILIGADGSRCSFSANLSTSTAEREASTSDASDGATMDTQLSIDVLESVNYSAVSSMSPELASLLEENRYLREREGVFNSGRMTAVVSFDTDVRTLVLKDGWGRVRLYVNEFEGNRVRRYDSNGDGLFEVEDVLTTLGDEVRYEWRRDRNLDSIYEEELIVIWPSLLDVGFGTVMASGREWSFELAPRFFQKSSTDDKWGELRRPLDSISKIVVHDNCSKHADVLEPAIEQALGAVFECLKEMRPEVTEALLDRLARQGVRFTCIEKPDAPYSAYTVEHLVGPPTIVLNTAPRTTNPGGNNQGLGKESTATWADTILHELQHIGGDDGDPPHKKGVFGTYSSEQLSWIPEWVQDVFSLRQQNEEDAVWSCAKHCICNPEIQDNRILNRACALCAKDNLELKRKCGVRTATEESTDCNPPDPDGMCEPLALRCGYPDSVSCGEAYRELLKPTSCRVVSERVFCDDSIDDVRGVYLCGLTCPVEHVAGYYHWVLSDNECYYDPHANLSVVPELSMDLLFVDQCRTRRSCGG